MYVLIENLLTLKNIKSIMLYMKLFETILDVIFPRTFKCVICNGEISKSKPPYICDRCLKTLPYNNGKICLKCGSPIYSMADYCVNCKDNIRYFSAARAPFLYSDSIVQMVHDFKYNNKKYLFESVAALMADCYSKNNFNAELIIPVPASKARVKQRGYNQVELIGEHLSKILNVPQICNALIKASDTQPQTSLTYFERQKNLLGSIYVNDKSLVKGKIVLLIDDVLTTGATVNYCSELLKLAGAKEVLVLTLARTQGERFKNNEKTLANFKKRC